MSGFQQKSTSKASGNSSTFGRVAADPPTTLSNNEEEEDRKHLQKIITALRLYRKYSYARVYKAENYINTLPKRHQAMLTKYRKHLSHLRDCIDENQTVIKRMLSENDLSDLNGGSSSSGDGGGGGGGGSSSSSNSALLSGDANGHAVKLRTQDIENAQSTLKLIARDWSDEGAEERRQSYKPIIDAIEEFYNPNDYALNQIKVLVPGAGLGRLTYELACRGYDCEGNEFSFFMMIASNFVLNQCTEARKYTLYPWIHQYVNNLRMEDQVAVIRFPDVCPVKNQPKGNLAIAAGDFLQVYTHPDCYDCVATCFFIDCANNIIEFIETIYRILVPGGIWVNLGPLLYHYSDIQGEYSIEPTYENLVPIIQMVGFEIVRNQTGIRTAYAQNPRSMLKTEYESVFWICRKPLKCANDSASQDGRDNDSTDSLDQQDDFVDEKNDINCEKKPEEETNSTNNIKEFTNGQMDWNIEPLFE